MKYELFAKKLREQFPQIEIPEEYFKSGPGSTEKLFIYLKSQGINTNGIKLEAYAGSKSLREKIIGRKLIDDLERNLNDLQPN